MFLNDDDIVSILLTFRLAILTTLLSLFLSLVTGYITVHIKYNFIRGALNSILSLPLILPPTVLGFYLLMFISYNGVLAQLGLPAFAFTFTGLLISSIIYSFPFIYLPILQGFEDSLSLIEDLKMLGLPTYKILFYALPMHKIQSVFYGFMICFAHTIGEFGVVLMVGGNIQGETKVVSISMYEAVEVLDYSRANHLAFLLLIISFVLIVLIGSLNSRKRFVC